MFAALLFSSCAEENFTAEENGEVLVENLTSSSARTNISMQLLDLQMKEDPQMASKRDAIELHTQSFVIQTQSTGVQAQATRRRDRGGGNGGGPNNNNSDDDDDNGNGGGNGSGGGNGNGDHTGTINIPVVVHVLYNNSTQNVSKEQIESQIDVFNADYGATNNDFANIPSEFIDVAADIDIQSELIEVKRVRTSTSEWGVDNAVRSAYSNESDAVSPNKVLNIWVCNLANNVQGYAQFPGGQEQTDGVVVSTNFFGTMGTVQSPNDRGGQLHSRSVIGLTYFL